MIVELDFTDRRKILRCRTDRLVADNLTTVLEALSNVLQDHHLHALKSRVDAIRAAIWGMALFPLSSSLRFRAVPRVIDHPDPGV